MFITPHPSSTPLTQVLYQKVHNPTPLFSTAPDRSEDNPGPHLYTAKVDVHPQLPRLAVPVSMRE